MVESIKPIIKLFLDKGYLITPDIIEKSEMEINFFENNLKNNESGELLIFNENMLKELLKKKDKLMVKEEKLVDEIEIEKKGIKIIDSYDKIYGKLSVQNFTMHYQKRYDHLKRILQSRNELLALLSINRILSKKDRESVSTIGMVFEKNYTKNNNLILNIEDNTGNINVLINNNKKELFEKAKDIVLDETIGIKGANGDKIIFADEIFFPDISQNEPIKKSPNEEYLAVISDLHIGSELFLEEEFLRFIEWINGKSGNKDQKEISQKIKYLLVVGDIVDGVGIYPNQDDEQNIPDIVLQYDKAAELLKLIRKDVNIIICPGNHDAVRLAEPQPILDKNTAKSLYGIDNIFLVSNPSSVNIGADESFEGFEVLLYHGYSYDDYSANVESIRFSGATVSDRTNMVMKFLLQKRHLAPTHGSSLFIPDSDADDLIIKNVPDFFVSGHIHKANVTQYGKVTKIAGSCWQSITPFQIKVGHSPEPGRVPIINLKTRDTKILKFAE
ncbi:DNA-directed DNA polymerase II small subunit [Candidatus Woesearchaeota archaeon]|jgi:DNA polymerase II small subunit|nr:DNA-directed DNA polymerase II small subunit [Candidatus Woesearchaeota archaeon]MBT4630980.1 DNA-directed DNA polymerase II small subunit [Candidatus Woesearchaeota archaeon]